MGRVSKKKERRGKVKASSSHSYIAPLLVRIIKVFVLVLIFSSVFFVVASVVAVSIFSRRLPSTEQLRENYNPPQTNKFYSADGKLIGETYIERRTVVKVSDIPRCVINAILAAEDADFFKHRGLDYLSILRALMVDILSGEKRQGASTITQQVARAFYLGNKKTFRRKFKELLLARRIEQNMSKQQILFLYLNQIYWGHSRYGIEEASLFYTGKSVREIDIAEAALLAGIPRGPEIYSPFKNPSKALARRNWVLGQMAEKGFISRSIAERAMDEPLPSSPHEVYDSSVGAEFVTIVQRILRRIVGEEKLRSGGYKVITTMNYELQKIAKEAVRKGLKRFDKKHRFKGPVGYRYRKGEITKAKCPYHPPATRAEPGAGLAEGKIYVATVVDYDDEENRILLRAGETEGVVYLEREKRYNPYQLPPSKFIREGCTVRISLLKGEGQFKARPYPRFQLEMGPQSALVAIDVKTSSVVALVGGYGYRKGDFNRAIYSRRQPGSAFKPIVYITALEERKVTPATLIEDTPLGYDDFNPNNFERFHFEGRVRLRKALADSINLVAVRVAEIAGIKSIVEMAHRLGIKSKLEPNLALALGASGVTPLELANAYATIARGGIKWEPIFVTKIVGPDGKGIELPKPEPPARAVSEQAAFIITSMLESVIKEGTGKRALMLKRPCAGKTGTSNYAKDAWFAGFTPSIVTVVWAGFDDYKSLGKNETGSSVALPIWIDFMKRALRGTPAERFASIPKGVVIRSIDPETGLLARENQPDSLTEFFIEGTEPNEVAPAKDVVVEDTHQ